MANETKRLTPEAEREIDSRVNPQYSDTPGTESNERALLLSEIQHLRQERDAMAGDLAIALRKLVDFEAQEPVLWAPSIVAGPEARKLAGMDQSLTAWFDRPDAGHPGRGHCQTPLFTRPVPAQAVQELEAKVFSQEQALEVLRTCVARHQRDEADPPGYLQDAVIKAAGLGALHMERDMYRRACGKLRARLAELKQQEPVAEIRQCGCTGAKNDRCVMGDYGSLPIGTKLYAGPVAATLEQQDRALREPVLLTDAEVRQIADATLYRGSIYERVRAIEAAVLAKNGLEAAR
jgi:hypothetical protein